MAHCRYHIHEKYRHDIAVQSFVNNVDRDFGEKGDLLFSGARNTIKRFNLAGEQRLVVKCFRSKNWLQQFAYSFLIRSKAQRAFYNGLKLEEIGCGTPQPIAYVEQRWCGWLQRCYYITAYTSDPSVRKALEEDFNHPLADAFAQFVARLHDNGVVHHDLNFSNVLYHEEGEKYHISVIDINRMTVKTHGRLSISQCKDDYVRWTNRKDLFDYIMRAYAMARGWSTEPFYKTALAMKEKHDKAWKRRKKLTGRLKQLLGIK